MPTRSVRRSSGFVQVRFWETTPAKRGKGFSTASQLLRDGSMYSRICLLRSFLRKSGNTCTIDRPETFRYTLDMTATGILTEADILREVVGPDRPTFSPELIQELLSLKFNDVATERIRDLLQKNNSGTITPAERSTLKNYLRVGEFLDLMQAKARVTRHLNGSVE